MALSLTLPSSDLKLPIAKITTSVDDMVAGSTSHRQCCKMWSLNPRKRKWGSGSGSYTKQLTNWSSAVERVLLV